MRNIVLNDLNGCNEVFEDILNILCYNKKDSLIDLCCNLAPFTGKLNFRNKVYLDIIERKLIYPYEQHRFIQHDVLKDHEVFNKKYDVCTCLDGIEHVTKEQGFQLIEKMKSISNRVVIFTPLDAWMMESPGSEKYEKDPESHKSLWKPEIEFSEWNNITLPVYHPTLGVGAFFSWYCDNIEEDFIRVKNEIKKCSWFKK